MPNSMCTKTTYTMLVFSTCYNKNKIPVTAHFTFCGSNTGKHSGPTLVNDTLHQEDVSLWFCWILWQNVNSIQPQDVLLI